jgi:hypothetical protein
VTRTTPNPIAFPGSRPGGENHVGANGSRTESRFVCWLRTDWPKQEFREGNAYQKKHPYRRNRLCSNAFQPSMIIRNRLSFNGFRVEEPQRPGAWPGAAWRHRRMPHTLSLPPSGGVRTVRVFGTCINATHLGAGNIIAVPGMPGLSWVYPTTTPMTDRATGVDELLHLVTDLTMVPPITSRLGRWRAPRWQPTARRSAHGHLSPLVNTHQPPPLGAVRRDDRHETADTTSDRACPRRRSSARRDRRPGGRRRRASTRPEPGRRRLR